MEHIEYVYTRGMTETELEERLSATPTGVLALANDDDTYAIPLAHYYDDGRLYLRLGMTDGSQKQTFIETTATATYVVYGDSGSTDSWSPDSWSIIVRGRLAELPPEKRSQFDTATINRAFSAIRVFNEAIEDIDIRLFEFEIDSLTGRATLESADLESDKETQETDTE